MVKRLGGKATRRQQCNIMMSINKKQKLFWKLPVALSMTMNGNREHLNAVGVEDRSGAGEYDQSLTRGWKANVYAKGHLAKQRFVEVDPDDALLYDNLIFDRNSFNI